VKAFTSFSARWDHARLRGSGESARRIGDEIAQEPPRGRESACLPAGFRCLAQPLAGDTSVPGMEYGCHCPGRPEPEELTSGLLMGSLSPSETSGARLHPESFDDDAKRKEWNRADVPAASHFFPPIAEKEAA
jgi:hypothetical protein